MASTTPPMSPYRQRPRRCPAARVVEPYCRLTLAFVLGFYVPWAATAPDLLRHFGEAVHSWAILFFAPVAAWRLTARALARPEGRGRVERRRG